MSFFTENKEKVTAILSLVEESAKAEDQDMLVETLQNVPDSFWKDKECSTAIMSTFLDWIRSCFSIYPIEFIPDFFWEEEDCVWSYVVTLCDLYDEEQIDYNLTELLPRKLLTNKKLLKLLLYYNYEETVSYIPDEYQNDTEIILEALEGLEHLAERRENNYNSMVGPLDEKGHLEYFVSKIPSQLSSDMGFVMSLLEHDLVASELEVLYGWIDEKFWSDKDFVLKILELDEETPLEKISKELMSDNEFMSALDNIFDVYELGCEFADDGDDRSVMCMLYAAHSGCAEAQALLAEMYRYGNGVERDLQEALKWYKAAAEKGEMDAQYCLADMYYFGRDGVEKDLQEALKWYRAAAESGNRSAIYTLGHMYYYGDGVEQDYNQAYYWFDKDGFRELPYYICADMYFYVDKHYESAFRLYESALEQGVDFAAYKIGEMYYYGLGVEQDYAKAFEYLKYYNGEFDEGCIDLAPANVHYMLGEMYKNGWGVEANPKEAEKLFRAAEQGEKA